jgi:hypothetical protein
MAKAARAGFVAAVLLLGGINPAQTAPVQFAGNGHWYEILGVDLMGSGSGNIPTDWPTARALAAAAVCPAAVCGQDLAGHLATITTAEEDAFIAALGGATPLWAAGQRFGGVAGTWRWVDGPEAGQSFWIGGPAETGGTAVGTDTGYANWLPFQPQEIGNFLVVNSGDRWESGPEIYLFLVEYESPVAVPAPSLLLLLAASVAGLAAVRRRRMS